MDNDKELPPFTQTLVQTGIWCSPSNKGGQSAPLQGFFVPFFCGNEKTVCEINTACTETSVNSLQIMKNYIGDPADATTCITGYTHGHNDTNKCKSHTQNFQHAWLWLTMAGKDQGNINISSLDCLINSISSEVLQASVSEAERVNNRGPRQSHHR